MDKRTVWIHIHIPKSGGLTLNEILKKNFGKGFKSNYSLLDNYHYSQQQIEKIIDSHKKIACLADHKASTNLPYLSQDVDFYAITTFRNPVDRFLSGYFYNRGISQHYVPETKTMTLDQFIEYQAQNKQDFYFYQVCRATGKPLKEAIETFKSLIAQEKLFVLPLTSFAKSCLVLEKKYPNFFSDCSYQIKNQSKRDQKVSQTQKEKIIEIGGKGYEMELKLLNFIEDHIDKNLDNFLEKEEQQTALIEFKKRCNQKKESSHSQSKSSNLVKKIFRKIYGFWH